MDGELQNWTSSDILLVEVVVEYNGYAANWKWWMVMVLLVLLELVVDIIGGGEVVVETTCTSGGGGGKGVGIQTRGVKWNCWWRWWRWWWNLLWWW